MSEIKKVSTEIVHDHQPWWQYKCDKIIDAGGAERQYCYIETLGNAFVVPVLDDGRLVLIRQYRYLADKYSVEFPGGGIQADETPAEAAKRELLEESGYDTDSLIKIAAFEPDSGVVKDLSHVFIAHELTLVKEPEIDQLERVEIIIRRIDEFEEMIKRGEIWNGQVLAVWALAKDLIAQTISSQNFV